MEAVIHQPLRQVINLKTGAAAQVAQIKDAFMGHEPALSTEQNRVMGIEAMGQIVGGEQGHGGCLAQTSGAHQAQIHPADRQDACTTKGSRRYRGDGLSTTAGHQWMTREEGQQMFTHSDGTNARATPAMGNAERLVQVEVADIRSEGTRPADTDLGVEIGAIEVHLAAMLMHEAADLTDTGLEHPMG